jgi:hypothetical protein
VVVGLLKTEIAICDFPKRLGPWIPSWTRVCNPEEIGVRHSGFSSAKGLQPVKSRSRDSRGQREEATWQGGITRAHRSSGFGVLWCK